jgi:hypothetical protein
MDYVQKYNITAEKLRQQLISGQITSTVKQYPDWVRKRAVDLAKAGNELLEELRKDLKIPDGTADIQMQEHAFAVA